MSKDILSWGMLVSNLGVLANVLPVWRPSGQHLQVPYYTHFTDFYLSVAPPQAKEVKDGLSHFLGNVLTN